MGRACHGDTDVHVESVGVLLELLHFVLDSCPQREKGINEAQPVALQNQLIGSSKSFCSG